MKDEKVTHEKWNKKKTTYMASEDYHQDQYHHHGNFETETLREPARARARDSH